MTERIDNWLLGPVGQCVLYLSEEMVYSSLVRRGLTTMTGMVPFFALASGQFEKAGIDTAQLKRMARDYLSWESKAKEHIDSNFSTVHRHSLIGLWCVVETAVEDSVMLILERSPQAEELLSHAGYRPSQSPILGLEREKLYRVYAGLEKQARDRGNIAVAWLDLLSALDVKFSISKDAISAIAEVNEVRNCILHRGGEIDERAASKAPGLKPLIGQKIEIGEKQYLRYYDALREFTINMINGVINSCHCKWRSTGGQKIATGDV